MYGRKYIYIYIYIYIHAPKYTYTYIYIYKGFYYALVQSTFSCVFLRQNNIFYRANASKKNITRLISFAAKMLDLL